MLLYEPTLVPLPVLPWSKKKICKISFKKSQNLQEYFLLHKLSLMLQNCLFRPVFDQLKGFLLQKISETQNLQEICKSQRTFFSHNQTLKFARIAKKYQGLAAPSPTKRSQTWGQQKNQLLMLKLRVFLSLPLCHFCCLQATWSWNGLCYCCSGSIFIFIF